MDYQQITYGELNSRQKEIYNFQKVAGVLADYGFTCIKLADDWQGADFLAYHIDGVTTFRVQLKARLTIDKKYCGKNLHLAFPASNQWYLVPHDDLIDKVEEYTGWLATSSWMESGQYSSAAPNRQLLDAIACYRIS